MRILDVNGPVATTALGGLVLIAWLVAQVFAAAVLLAVTAAFTGEDIEALARSLETSGNTLCLLAAFAGIVAVLVARATRRPFGAWRFSLRAALLGVAATVAFHLVAGFVGSLAGRPEAPQYVLDLFRSASLPVFALAIIVVAPLWEEVLFRGLLFESWTRVHPAVAIGFAALTWSAIHLQYDLYDVSVLFLYGLILGVFRWRTGSVGLVVFLHAVFNTVALVELVIVAR